MPTFEESGLRVTLPDGAWFRFEQVPAYRRLCSYSVSEMDVGWWDADRQHLLLLEVKDYSVHAPEQDLPAKMIAKGRDCIVMLHAAWNATSDFGRGLCAALPEACRAPRNLRLRFVVKVGAGLTPDMLTSYADKVQLGVKAYADLLGLRCRVAVLDHHKAIEKGLVTSIDPPAS